MFYRLTIKAVLLALSMASVTTPYAAHADDSSLLFSSHFDTPTVLPAGYRLRFDDNLSRAADVLLRGYVIDADAVVLTPRQ